MNEKDLHRDSMYAVSGAFIADLYLLMRRLYTHDSKRINADESRDWANWLYAQLPHAEEMP